MNSLKQIREPPLYKQLRGSIAFRQTRYNCIFWGIFPILLTLLEIWAFSSYPSTEYLTLTDVTYILFTFVLYLVFAHHLHQLAQIFFHIDRYVVSEVVLDRPHMRRRHPLTFTVTVKDRWGMEFETETQTVLLTPRQDLSDYVNHRALVAYNDKTNLVLLLELLDNGGSL